MSSGGNERQTGGRGRGRHRGGRGSLRQHQRPFDSQKSDEAVSSSGNQQAEASVEKRQVSGATWRNRYRRRKQSSGRNNQSDESHQNRLSGRSQSAGVPMSSNKSRTNGTHLPGSHNDLSQGSESQKNNNAFRSSKGRAIGGKQDIHAQKHQVNQANQAEGQHHLNDLSTEDTNAVSSQQQQQTSSKLTNNSTKSRESILAGLEPIIESATADCPPVIKERLTAQLTSKKVDDSLLLYFLNNPESLHTFVHENMDKAYSNVFRREVQNASIDDQRRMIRERLDDLIKVQYQATSEHVTFLINKLMDHFQVEDLLDLIDDSELLDAKIIEVTQFDDLQDTNDGHSDVSFQKDLHEANISPNLLAENANDDWPALPTAHPKKKIQQEELLSSQEVGFIASTPNVTNNQVGHQSEFTECNYCGLSIYDLVDDYDDFTPSGTNQRKNSGKASCKSGAKTVKIKTCTRCKTVGYCSVDCQRSDYTKHKTICRTFGQSKSETPAPKLNKNEVTLIARKEYYPLNTPPITGIWDKIEEDINLIASQDHIVIHSLTINSSNPTKHGYLHSLPGVYSREATSPSTFIRDATASVQDRDVSILENYGYHFNFTNTDVRHKLIYKPSCEKMRWIWMSEDGTLIGIVSDLPYQSHHKDFLTDPMSLYSMSVHRHTTSWYLYTSDSIQRGGASISNFFIALTPFETLKEAVKLGPPRSIPKKFKAPDYNAWEKSIVIHADYRNFNSSLSIDLVDSLMGVYSPVLGKRSNGYPVWERDFERTSLLIESIPNDSKKYLEENGISLHSSSNLTEGQVLLVHLTCWGDLALAIAKETKSSEQYTPLLTSQYIPENIDELLSVPTALFSKPDSSFSNWKGTYCGKEISVDVAMTPHEYFEQTVTLAGIEIETRSSTYPIELAQKSNKKKRKKKPPVNASAVSSSVDIVNESSIVTEQLDPIEMRINDGKYQIFLNQVSSLANESFCHLASKLGLDESKVAICQDISSEVNQWSLEEVMEFLFHVDDNCNGDGPAWVKLSSSITSHVLEAALNNNATEAYIQEHASNIIEILSHSKPIRQEDFTVLFNHGVTATAKSIAALFSNLQEGAGHQFNNKIAKLICSKVDIILEHSGDFRLVQAAANKTVGKNTRKELTEVLKRASAKTTKVKCHKRSAESFDSQGDARVVDHPPLESNKSHEEIKTIDSISDEKEHVSLNDFASTESISSALQWYSNLLESLLNEAPSTAMPHTTSADEIDKPKNNIEECALTISSNKHQSQQRITVEEVGQALSMTDISEEKLAELEAGIDLQQWDDASETTWTIDITENAHKWIKKHIKRDRLLCERVIRRLTMLSTGRWPYVLCKPLTKLKKIQLYETKLDSGSRIIWEVATAFSPRRSNTDQNFCEQVIRVWDIVLDHDNLSRTISQTIERIEKSHQRGEECALFAQIDKDQSDESARHGFLNIPRVFPMSMEVCTDADKRQKPNSGKANHFHPASDDPRQFTLLKFYELNSAAVKMLLDGEDEDIELPFTPGPKEHAIIHHRSNPQKSILLMGRSGTGKTTCLVFRMWAQWIGTDANYEQPRQVFLTKNNVLCSEVKRSFNNMGLAWRKRSKGTSTQDITNPKEETSSNSPKFMTSSDWLDLLDEHLPGDPFFTTHEREQRRDGRKEKDTVMAGIEEFLSEEVDVAKHCSIVRQEMTFHSFRRKVWRKIKGGVCTQLDAVLVWREIISFIKGSVLALHIDHQERSKPQNRFLNLEEYLSLPRKQSRMDEAQRRVVYSLFMSYEKIKKEMHFYDECDLVFNIAGRVLNLSDSKCLDGENSAILPIDSVFVDEIQDWTQAEIFILTQLCRDPNNLFLAGDTAQSIAVGVDFRFTDVRQTFYNHFGGIEPELLQLTHNYRSHSGVLRLAACVVELLYFFFSNSLDRLPPDLGLFEGPRPTIMEVASTEDLVLMLDGAKRETSRIEFGAHQVVIVRNEDAKQNLPDEFGVDRDWVMTVQQSKGLEFDDVLLYNFFSDSVAGDIWRVVANYRKEHVEEYYADITVSSSGVQTYEWESSLLSNIRHLDFDKDKHKILETELKQLYTAITRARVNVFIAETNIEQARPMFDYFQRRRVVDLVNKDNQEGLESIRVFGVMNNVEDWKNRGEYYLQNAEGERQKGCLRLAAKCFEKAGDMKRRDFALALVTFTELEEQDHTRRKGKHSNETKQRLYRITSQLLEARDVGFLNKAALCLLRTGEHDLESAQMFELYGRICYAKRCNEMHKHQNTFLSPSVHETNYFSYAAKLFERCSTSVGKSSLALDSFRNFCCAKLYDSACKLLQSQTFPLQTAKTFKQLHEIIYSEGTHWDPITSFQTDFRNGTEECKSLINAIAIAAKIGCRSLIKEDKEGFVTALSLMDKHDRIQFLFTVQEDLSDALSKRPWKHVFFNNTKQETRTMSKSAIDLTQKLVTELEREGRYEEAASILEERGYLLEAASMLEGRAAERNEETKNAGKAMSLRVRYAELMILSNSLPRDQMDSLLLTISLDKLVTEDDRLSFLFSKHIAHENYPGLFNIVASLGQTRTSSLDTNAPLSASVLWRIRALSAASNISHRRNVLDNLPGTNAMSRLNFLSNIIEMLRHLVAAFHKRKRTAAENLAILQVETYFDLVPKQFDPTQAETNSILNLRLREVMHDLNCNLPLSPGSLSQGFKVSVDRAAIQLIISKYLDKKVGLLLNIYYDLINVHRQKVEVCMTFRSRGVCNDSKCSKKHSFALNDTNAYFDCLQIQLCCLNEISNALTKAKQQDMLSNDPWVDLDKHLTQGRSLVHDQILEVLFNERRAVFIKSERDDSSDLIMLHPNTIHALEYLSKQRFFKQHIRNKREDISFAIKHHRILSLCQGKSHACEMIDNEITRIEKHRETQVYDSNRRKMPYYINTKGKIFPRLWLWAIESVPEDIMNAIAVVERIINTSYRNVHLNKSMQIDLLEVNTLALFSTLSLRYSTSSAPEILIPKSYHDALLTGQTGLSCLQGFGVPLKDCLIKYCHAHFDDMFQAVVQHIETTAHIIIENKLLSYEEKGSHDIGRFKKAFTLSMFLCCNAIIFSAAGADMNTWEYKNLNSLPSIPLQGNVRKLIAELQAIFTQQLFPPYMTLANAIPIFPATFLDAINVLKSLLGEDYLILCEIKQAGRDHVRVHYYDVSQSVLSLLGNVAFDSGNSVFAEWTKSQSFLDIIAVTDHTNQDEEQGKKSEEAYASRKIARLVRKPLDPVLVAAAIVSFRHLKAVLRRFSRIIHARYKKNHRDDIDDTSNDATGDNNIQYILKNIPNLLGDQRQFSTRRDIIRDRLHANTVVDSIECTFCCATFSPDLNLPSARYYAYTMNGKYMGVPYRQFSQGYNMSRFHNELGNHFDMGEVLNYHIHSVQHANNYQLFSKCLEHVATVMARLNLCREFLCLIIQSCSAEGQLDASSLKPWYLSTAEQAQVLLSNLDSINTSVEGDAQVWSVYWHNPNPVDQHNGIYDLLERVETFYSQKLLEEEDMKQGMLKQMEQSDGNDTGVAEDNPIYELMRGPYLNGSLDPNAKEFVPGH